MTRAKTKRWTPNQLSYPGTPEITLMCLCLYDEFQKYGQGSDVGTTEISIRRKFEFQHDISGLIK